MINIKKLKENLETTIEKLNNRGENFGYLKKVVDLDNERIKIIQDVEKKKAFKNLKSKEIGLLKRSKKPFEFITKEMSAISIDIDKLDYRKKEIEAKIKELLLKTPNVPCETSPIGNDENDNVTLRKYGDLPSFKFKPMPHEEIGINLNLLDFKSAAKISGSRFVVYKGEGARLKRAISQFFLDYQTQENGFKEISTPYIANANSMINTGQLPKFEDDLYKVGKNQYLIPTSEVTLVNYFKETVINVDKPIKVVAHTPCFRKEAGSAGKDVKGIIRQHQFDKVEMVKFTKPQDSVKSLEKMVKYAEILLQKLKLPYRVVSLCTGDMGFASAKTYDIEVWFPSQNKYREISSCSNTFDFQARRANIKYRDKNKKLDFVHSLNGSGLPIGRTFAAILENYQQEDGSIIIPDVLVPYFGKKHIK